MRGSRKKCEKPPFFVTLGQKAHFGLFLAKMAKTVKIIKKALGTFFSHLQALTKCKVSEKSKERFPIKSVTYVRTHVRTYVRTHVRTHERTRLLWSQTTIVERPKKNKKISKFLTPFFFLNTHASGLI